MDSILVSDKIRIETVKLSMAEEIFLAIDNNREQLSKWLPFVDMTLQVSDTENFLRGVINQSGNKRDEIYVIRFNNRFAGLIGFKETDWINKKTELGYWLIPELEGKGIVSQSVKMLVTIAFKKLKLNRVQIKVATGNHKSAAIPKRLGFHYEGIEREGEYRKGDYYDLETYSLLKKDFFH